MENLWKKIIEKKKPFFAVAPMADVTDFAFRKTICKMSRHGKVGGGPDIFWTEFVSADGLSSKKGRPKLLRDLKFSKNEKPIIAQIFGANPQNIEEACRIVEKLGFDGIDINMGCPDRKVEKQGAGAALMKNPILAREILQKAISGAGALPISVKTRIGFNKIEYKEWLSEILKENISALTIHLRTRKELSKTPAHWELAKEISKFVKSKRKNIVLIANGDISSIKDGLKKIKGTKFDGLMVGRGIFGNPWFFDQKKKSKISPKEKCGALLYHTKIFEKEMLDRKRFDVMKKHFKAYISDFDGAKGLRAKLMQTNSAKDVEKVIKEAKL